MYDTWDSPVHAKEIAKVIMIIKAVQDLRIEIAQPDNPEYD